MLQYAKGIDDIIMIDVEKLIKIIALKSQSTAKHCIRVSKLSLEIGKAYNIPATHLKELFISSILHDIGKIYIPDEILNKTCKLTEKEYEAIKAHCKIGFEFLNKTEKFRNVANIVLHHHEKFDGKGYPCGLKGKEIPLLSRIITVADSFDAMVSIRPYKSKINFSEAIKEIQKNIFTHFDEDIVNTFINIIAQNKVKNIIRQKDIYR